MMLKNVLRRVSKSLTGSGVISGSSAAALLFLAMIQPAATAQAPAASAPQPGPVASGQQVTAYSRGPHSDSGDTGGQRRPAEPALPRFQTLIVGMDQRKTTTLDGDWHYLVDQAPFRELYTGSGEINDRGYAMNTHPNITSGPHNAEYDFATAPTLKVPGDWNTQVPQLFSYEGVVFYERDFDVQPKPGTRTFLHIGAANYRSHVWVNQKRVCDHEGGFTPFDCEMTAVLHPGSNFVVIGVDATRLVDGIPSVGYDWYNYGGLTRDVSLLTVPTAFIDDYDVHLAHGPAWQPGNTELTGYVHVLDAPAGTPVTLDIPEAGVHSMIKTDADGRAPFDVKARKLTLWSPETPKLYKVTLASGSGDGQDKLTDDIGLRDIRVDGTHR